MGAITGYRPTAAALPQLLSWLNDLDHGWLAVLRSQAWDPDAREGSDVPQQINDAQSLTDAATNPTSSPMTQTERTRLRSLLISGTGRLEEWLVELDTGGQDYTAVLETMGLQHGFDDLFTGTLAEMGSLNGIMNVAEGMTETC